MVFSHILVALADPGTRDLEGYPGSRGIHCVCAGKEERREHIWGSFSACNRLFAVAIIIHIYRPDILRQRNREGL